MNTLALGFNVISILIVLLALVISGVAYIIAPPKKKADTFHGIVQLIDIVLIMWCMIITLISSSAMALLMADVAINVAAFVKPAVLGFFLCCYFVLKQALYGSVTKLFNSKYGKAV